MTGTSRIFRVIDEEECLANCTGHASNDKVPDPNNCTQYYVCSPGQVSSDDPFSCSVGEEFDPVNGNCTAAYGCKPTCVVLVAT
ncbi:hypothetical protein SK128_025853 [Halocaridina rubra]|uniref:Chitin-binding type-2 domain-containing protein n=1 Tax=Halocaridina rubra TaxID=373956 RepID=A0AAN8XJK2_HALRR